jgi:hypothetical protein
MCALCSLGGEKVLQKKTLQKKRMTFKAAQLALSLAYYA